MGRSKAFNLLTGTDRSLRVTGIGSVPFVDPDEACETILAYCPLFPYVPQLIKRNFRENMFVQFSENLPCLGVNPERQHVYFDETRDREKELGELYENLEHDRYEHFRIGPQYSSALSVMLDKCGTSSAPFIKTQVTGPVTYLCSLSGSDGRPLIYDEEFSEAIMLGLAMKGLWQTREIRKTGRTPVLFFDEPTISDLGSAHTPVSGERARSIIAGLLDVVKKRDPDLLTGIHCCGNTDWGMLLESGVDIVSLDSYRYGDKLTLYPGEVKRFMERGGFIAFGIVPTSEFGRWTVEQMLYDEFVSLVKRFEEGGIPGGDLLDHAIFTPACGMGPLKPADADRILGFVASLTVRIHGLQYP